MSVLSEKLLLMGLSQSGKSTVASIIFKGKNIEEITDYNATIGYHRESRNFLGDTVQILDCGGQDAYIHEFLDNEAEFIFSNVVSLIWVVDTSNPDQISSSRFYFDIAAKRLNKFSPNATIFCLFHKMDLIMEDKRDLVFNTMQQYFKAPEMIKQLNFKTTIYNQSIFNVFGEILQNYISDSPKLQHYRVAISKFMTENSNQIAKISILTVDGIPVIEGGTGGSIYTEKPISEMRHLVISLLGMYDKFKSYRLLGTIIELSENNYLIFKPIKGNLILSVSTKNTNSLDEIEKRFSNLIISLNEI